MFDGKFDDFSTSWYKAVAPQLGVTMALQIFSPHIYPMLIALNYCMRRYWDKGVFSLCSKSLGTKKMLKAAYEQLYVGPEFTLDIRLGQIVALVWVTLFFLPTMPFLSIFVAIAFYVMFWVDKYMLLRFYRTPKEHDSQSLFYTFSRLKWSVLIHACMGVFLLSNMSILSSSTVWG